MITLGCGQVARASDDQAYAVAEHASSLRLALQQPLQDALSLLQSMRDVMDGRAVALMRMQARKRLHARERSLARGRPPSLTSRRF